MFQDVKQTTSGLNLQIGLGVKSCEIQRMRSADI